MIVVSEKGSRIVYRFKGATRAKFHVSRPIRSWRCCTRTAGARGRGAFRVKCDGSAILSWFSTCVLLSWNILHCWWTWRTDPGVIQKPLKLSSGDLNVPSRCYWRFCRKCWVVYTSIVIHCTTNQYCAWSDKNPRWLKNNKLPSRTTSLSSSNRNANSKAAPYWDLIKWTHGCTNDVRLRGANNKVHGVQELSV